MGHAVLSPSAASRWLTCTPSARLEERFPDVTSDFAREGSLAHEFGELRLKKLYGIISEKEWYEKTQALTKEDLYNEALEEYADEYAAFVWEKFQLALKENPNSLLRIEEKLNLTHYVPEGFGTGDAIVLNDGTMEIIDLKYGKGVQVSAVENMQMMLYALGALYLYELEYDINLVRMTIYQPRLDNVSEWEIEADALLEWGEKDLKPRAAIAFKGEGDFVPGTHCRFCRAKAQCKALAEKNIEAAKHDFDDAGLLSDEEVAAVLAEADGIKTWITAVEEYALAKALEGKRFPGFKLVEGRSIRKYADEAKVAETLAGQGFAEDQIYKPKELKTITAMEKLLTKKGFNALLGELVVKPAGKPTLAPIDDRRAEWSSVESDFKNINTND